MAKNSVLACSFEACSLVHDPAMSFFSNTDLRLLAAAVAVASWLTLLFTGLAFGGLVHGVLLLGLVLVPWRAIPRSTSEIVDSPQDAVAQRGDGQPD